MTFEAVVIAICDRFVSQRAFDLIVTPALADLEFEEAAGRHSRFASRAAVLRAIAGGVGHDVRRGSGGFLRLTLLSTWLGHVDPANTYWYLSASPELMTLAGRRLEAHLAGRP